MESVIIKRYFTQFSEELLLEFRVLSLFVLFNWHCNLIQARTDILISLLGLSRDEMIDIESALGSLPAECDHIFL